MEFSAEKNLSVCFFDSGIGGLNLLCECVKRLPEVNFKYFADNYNVPYGNMTDEELIRKTDGIFSEIEKIRPEAAVIACNTVTARCAKFLRAKYSFPIVGVQPAVKPAAANGESCAVLATKATAYSDALKTLIEKYGNNVTQVVPCPDLALYIEKNIFSLDERSVYLLLPPLKAQNIVLGCTHYSFIKDFIKRRYNCAVFEGIDGTAAQLCKILGNCDHFEKICAISGNNDHFDEIDVKNALFAPNFEKILLKVEFIGGDEQKNKDVFKSLVVQSGYFGNDFPKKLKKY